MKIRLPAVCIFMLISIFSQRAGSQVIISNSYKNEIGLQHLKIDRAMIYTPQVTWWYNHHPSIVNFKGKLIALWSNGLIGEDSPGQRVVFSVSADFKHWSAIQV